VCYVVGVWDENKLQRLRKMQSYKYRKKQQGRCYCSERVNDRVSDQRTHTVPIRLTADSTASAFELLAI